MEVNAGMAGIVFYLAAAIFPNTIMAGKYGAELIKGGRLERKEWMRRRRKTRGDRKD